MRIIWWVYPAISKTHNREDWFFSTGESKKLSASVNSTESGRVQPTCFAMVPDKKKKKDITLLIAKFMQK